MLQVPTVTQDDLNAFHARTFGSVAPPPQLHFTASSSQIGDNADPALDHEDNLGYYHDGRKRTLTDDQIAMFRHTEIYSIIRERQVRRENGEGSENDGLDESGSHVGPAESPMPLDTRDRVDSAHRGHPNEDEIFSDDERTDRSPSVSLKKRKRHTADTGDRSGKAYTSRRLARELDAVVTDNNVLDYGDEPAERPRTPPVNSEEEKNEIHTGEMPNESLVPGQKIWWPVIQAD